MPADVGNQTLSLKYGAAGNSREINERFVNVRPTGIYQGGYLSLVDASNASLSALVCEIGDGTHQLRIETTTAVVVTVAAATPYVILRWAYTGDVADYMQILAVASGSILTTDLVVGLCTFTGGGSLNGFSYADRSNPNVQQLFLKVEPTEETELKVRIRAGRLQNAGETFEISDQKSSLFTAPASNSRIDLVYLDRSTGVVSMVQGTAAATPVAPDYAGKIVLAEVTIAAGATNITESMIEDKRNFVGSVVEADNTSLEFDSSGKLSIKDAGVTEVMLDASLSSALARNLGARTTLDSLGSSLITNTVYLANGDGMLTVKGNTYLNEIKILSNSANPPTLEIASANNNGGNLTKDTITVPIISGEYWKITGTLTAIFWVPFGSGQCVKQ